MTQDININLNGIENYSYVENIANLIYKKMDIIILDALAHENIDIESASKDILEDEINAYWDASGTKFNFSSPEVKNLFLEKINETLKAGIGLISIGDREVYFNIYKFLIKGEEFRIYTKYLDSDSIDKTNVKKHTVYTYDVATNELKKKKEVKRILLRKNHR